jgi:L-rhamnose mutarotase
VRKAFVMTLMPGCRAEYQRRHNPISPDLEAILKSHGVHNYSIFFDDGSDRLFAYVEIESEKQWNEIAGTVECQRWWASMKELMPTNADNSPVSAELEELFHLD